MKILDKYILFNFLKTFLTVFFILMMIFILQAIWMFISDFAGKDIEVTVIARFLFYYIPHQVPLLLPLTILVSSIMTFGQFSENYEFAAMKSAGISLQRAMGSLIVFIFLLGYATFVFADTIIPWSEFKAINLKNNIAKAKPAMAIVEGVFTDLGEYNIKVEKKSGDNDQYLENVVIHKSAKKNRGNFTVIKSESGELYSEENSNILQLILYNGNYYDEIIPKNYEERQRLPYVKSSFDEYTINIDLSDFNNVDFDDESVKHPYKMLNTSELRMQIDSFSTSMNNSKRRYNRLVNQRNGFYRLSGDYDKKETDSARSIPKTLQTNNVAQDFDLDKTDSLVTQQELAKNQQTKDTISAKTTSSKNKKLKVLEEYANKDEVVDLKPITTMDSIITSFEDRQWSQIFSRARSTVNSISPQVESQKNRFKNKYIIINKTEIQLHKKYAIGVACIILFFVGAPLGAIIRKGGIGLPLVFAIILFLIYHFIGILAQNAAETGKLSPFLSAWISTFVMFPLGIFLTHRATTDQGFGSFDFISVPIRKLLIKLKLDKYKTRE